MEQQSNVANLAIKTINQALDWIRLIIWTIPALLIIIGFIAYLFSPVFAFIANHWIAILVAIVILIGGIIAMAIYASQATTFPASKGMSYTTKQPLDSALPLQKINHTPLRLDPDIQAAHLHMMPTPTHIKARKTKTQTDLTSSIQKSQQNPRHTQPKQPSYSTSATQRHIHVFTTTEERLRPRGGHALFAYTNAWLTLTGMFDGNTIPRSVAVQIAGSTMVNYHTKHGNLIKIDQGLALTTKGRKHFDHRKIQGHAQSALPADVAAWTQFFMHGTGSKAPASANAVKRITL